MKLTTKKGLLVTATIQNETKSAILDYSSIKKDGPDYNIQRSAYFLLVLGSERLKNIDLSTNNPTSMLTIYQEIILDCDW